MGFFLKIGIALIWIMAFSIPKALSQNALHSMQLQVPWECAQTDNSFKASGSSFSITATEFRGEISVSSDSFQSFLYSISRRSQTDYFQCLLDFQLKLKSAYETAIYTQCLSSSRDPICQDRPNRVKSFEEAFLKSYGFEIIRYGSDAYRNAYTPPIIPGASVTPTLSPEEKERATQILSETCDLNSSDKAFYFDWSFIQSRLPTLFNRGDSCSKKIALQYLELLPEFSLSLDQCAAHPERCQERRDLIENTYQLLLNAGLRNAIPEGSTKNLLASLTCGAQEKPIDERLFEFNFLKDEVLSCVTPAENESVPASNYGERGLSYHYWLTRLPDRELTQDYTNQFGETTARGTHVKVYEATLFLAIYLQDLNPGGAPSTPPTFTKNDSHPQAQNFYSRLQSCLTSTQDFFRGPSGEYLNLSLKLDSKRNPTDPIKATRINLIANDSTLRSDSLNWGINLSCKTMLHETMHLLGLPDEYVEYSIGYYTGTDGKQTKSGHINEVKSTSNPGEAPQIYLTQKAYDCRAIGPRDSIMNNDTRAIKNVEPRLARKSCLCQEEDFRSNTEFRNCTTSLYHLNLEDITNCGPLATHSQMVINDPDLPENVSPVTTTFTQDTNKERAERPIGPSFQIEPENQTLLYGGQFRSITEPGCYTSNATYLLCAADAYRTSQTVESPSCSKGLPAICRDPNGRWVY